MSRGLFACVVVSACGIAVLLSADAIAQGKGRHGMSGSSSSKPVETTPNTGLRYLVPLNRARRDDIAPGLNPSVRVLAPSRFDWTWAMPAGLAALSPKDALTRYDSTQTRYQLFVPLTYRHAKSSPLILFLSASGSPDEFASWAGVCQKHAVLYASPHDAGDNASPVKRLRVALDVFDDIRRRMNVDTDRIYIGGLSEGGRTASEVAYAYPEFLGGLVAVGGASPLRGEPWLRDRVQERLSVALITGNLDYARSEMERYRYPVLLDLEIRGKLWVPRVGHAMPPANVLEEVFVWLELDQIRRRALGTSYPLARIAEGSFPDARTWSSGLVEEAKARLGGDKTRESGLMQLEGVTRRWKGSEAATAAERILADNAVGAGAWRNVYARRQQDFFFSEAKAIDSYLDGPLSAPDQRRKVSLMRVALDLWKQVLDNGADTDAGRRAKNRVDELKKLLDVR